jgi:hypothetical protein
LKDESKKTIAFENDKKKKKKKQTKWKAHKARLILKAYNP